MCRMPVTLSACFHVFPYGFTNSPTKLHVFQESLQDALTRLDLPWLWGASLEDRLSLKTLRDPVTPGRVLPQPGKQMM